MNFTDTCWFLLTFCSRVWVRWNSPFLSSYWILIAPKYMAMLSSALLRSKNKFIIQMKKCYSIFYFQYNFSISSLWFLFFPTLELVNVCFVSLYSWQSKLLKISVVFWLLPFGVNGRLRTKIKIRLFGDFVLGATRAQILTFPKIFSFLFVCW